MATATLPDPLTARQMEVYAFIFDYTMTHGFQPGVLNAMAHFGIRSPQGITCFLKALERKGWIAVTKQHNRSIRFIYRPDGEPFRGFVARD